MLNNLFLDGPQAGLLLANKGLPAYWDFPSFSRMSMIKVDPSVDSKPISVNITRYKLTFISVDKKWGLYSLAGNSDILLTLSEWITKPRSLKRPHPIYMEHRP